jgi:hypothetical protein
MQQAHRTFVSVLVAVITSAACSDSPVASHATGIDAQQRAARQTGTAGVYELSFLDNSRQPVTTLAVGGPELILKAHVSDASGNPAQSGSVEFQYCSLKGLPPGDITRADETPSIDCTTKAATWARLLTLSVDSNGNAFMNFGYVSIPRTIGFRFRYSSQRSGIASGSSVPQDFTWTN